MSNHSIWGEKKGFEDAIIFREQIAIHRVEGGDKKKKILRVNWHGGAENLLVSLLDLSKRIACRGVHLAFSGWSVD